MRTILTNFTITYITVFMAVMFLALPLSDLSVALESSHFLGGFVTFACSILFYIEEVDLLANILKK